MQKLVYYDSKLNFWRAFWNTLRLSELLIYDSSLFDSLQLPAMNEKDLCMYSVLKWGCTKLLHLPLKL